MGVSGNSVSGREDSRCKGPAASLWSSNIRVIGVEREERDAKWVEGAALWCSQALVRMSNLIISCV